VVKEKRGENHVRGRIENDFFSSGGEEDGKAVSNK